MMIRENRDIIGKKIAIKEKLIQYNSMIGRRVV